MVQNEVSILKGLNHKGIVKLIEFGEKGCVQKSSGQITDNLVYLLMEYIPGGTLFNLCERSGQMGEDIGRFFLHQFVDVIQDMHNHNIVHRDIKLENILINDDMSIKFADFGFATNEGIEQLRQFRGTKTYMAPEIKEGKIYNGKEVDIFSIGVVLFIMVRGIYPFTEATKNDQFYEHILNDKLDTYWNRVDKANQLSPAFRNFILKFFTLNGQDRITLDQIRSDPWFTQESGKTDLEIK